MKKLLLIVMVCAFATPVFADRNFPGNNGGGKDGIIIYPGPKCFPPPFDFICWIS